MEPALVDESWDDTHWKLFRWSLASTFILVILIVSLILGFVIDKASKSSYNEGYRIGEVEGIKEGRNGWNIIRDHGLELPIPPPPKRGGYQYTEEDKVKTRNE